MTLINSPFLRNDRTGALCWLLSFAFLNGVQAYFTELASDECLYWSFSLWPDWGYFESPPAVFIWGGLFSQFIKDEFFVRLFVILTSSVSLYLAWALAEKPKPWLFFGIAFSIPMLQFGGFFLAPDAPFVFFSILFLVAFQHFLKKPALKNAVVLGLLIACIGYSKYQGIIFLSGVFIANYKTLKNPLIGLSFGIALILLIPHLLWLQSHDWATVQFHLFFRTPEKWHWTVISNWILGQLVTWGWVLPLFFFSFKSIWRLKFSIDNTCLGIVLTEFLFFSFLGFKQQSEANWTATAILPVVILLSRIGNAKPFLPKWQKGLIMVSFSLILVFRLSLISFFQPYLPEFRNDFGPAKEKYSRLAKIAGDRPLIIPNHYGDWGKYLFYGNENGLAINAGGYRGNLGDLQVDREAAIQGKPAILLSEWFSEKDSFKLSTGEWIYYVAFENWTSFNRLWLYPEFPAHLQSGTEVEVKLRGVNKSTSTILIGQANQADCRLCMESQSGGKSLGIQCSESVLPAMEIEPGKEIFLTMKVRMPEMTGKILFSPTIKYDNKLFGHHGFPSIQWLTK